MLRVFVLYDGILSIPEDPHSLFLSPSPPDSFYTVPCPSPQYLSLFLVLYLTYLYEERRVRLPHGVQVTLFGFLLFIVTEKSES